MTSTLPPHDHDCAQPELHAPAVDTAYAPRGLSAPGRLDPQDSARITRRITSYSVLVGFILIILKYVIWKESESVGILSSLVHSGLDFIAALATFFGVRYAARAPDKFHSFGRGKAEGFIAVLQACLVLFSALHIFEEGIERYMAPQAVQQGGATLIIMTIAVVLTLCLLLAQSHAINSTGSVAIKGDRAHFMADMGANIAVIIGVALAAYTPFMRADAIVAILIALWLAMTAVRVAKLAYNQLMDVELPKTERDFIRALASDDEKVLSVSDLRTRASGPHVHIQMRVELSDTLTLVEANAIISLAEGRILNAFPAADVTIHPEPSGTPQARSRFRQG